MGIMVYSLHFLTMGHAGFISSTVLLCRVKLRLETAKAGLFMLGLVTVSMMTWAEDICREPRGAACSNQ